jgi:hypothetical protein
VTGGAITSAFLVPLTLAVAQDMYGNAPANILVYGFGIIGYISVTPIILVLILGLIYNAKTQKVAAIEKIQLDEFDELEAIEDLEDLESIDFLETEADVDGNKISKIVRKKDKNKDDKL